MQWILHEDYLSIAVIPLRECILQALESIDVYEIQSNAVITRSSMYDIAWNWGEYQSYRVSIGSDNCLLPVRRQAII